MSPTGRLEALEQAAARAAYADISADLASLKATGPCAQIPADRILSSAGVARAGLVASRPLEVPLGTITYARPGPRKPVVGMRLHTADTRDWPDFLAAFLAEHHRAPVLRPIFLVPDLTLVPLLGRYGFACHILNETTGSEMDFNYLLMRYDMRQVRLVSDGTVIWEIGRDGGD